jgi:hypothetical protein
VFVCVCVYQGDPSCLRELDRVRQIIHLCQAQRCYSGVTVVLQWCYSGVAVALQWCPRGVSVMSQWYYSDVVQNISHIL